MLFKNIWDLEWTTLLASIITVFLLTWLNILSFLTHGVSYEWYFLSAQSQFVAGKWYQAKKKKSVWNSGIWSCYAADLGFLYQHQGRKVKIWCFSLGKNGWQWLTQTFEKFSILQASWLYICSTYRWLKHNFHLWLSESLEIPKNWWQ